MLQFYYDSIDNYIEGEDFEFLEMNIDNYYFAFLEDCIDKLVKPHKIRAHPADLLTHQTV